METNLSRGDDGRALAEKLINLYYTTVPYPWTRHQIDSYDQFLSADIPAIIRSSNPMILLEDQIANTGEYSYKAEIFIGGLNGDAIFIGTPTVSLNKTEDVRIMLPNEARLRNLTYGSNVQADIYIRLTFKKQRASGEGLGFTETIVEMDPSTEKYSYLAKMPLFKIPIMLHSRYCILNGKPEEFIKASGECIYDYGGYFIVDGSEKVLITHQEQAFNTLYVQNQEREPQVATYATISCLNPTTRQVRRAAFGLLRRENTLQVTIPFVRKPVPVFILFRAFGIQSDEDIMNMIFPDLEDAEAKVLSPMLQESIVEAYPFLDTYSAIHYIKVLTKGFSEGHVLDIIHNQLFIHVEDRPLARAFYLAECVRKILRVAAGIDSKTDRDDTRNQRCLTSGFLTRMLFQGVYTKWVKAALQSMDEEYNYNVSNYSGENFMNLFTLSNIFRNLKRTDVNTQPDQFITAGIMRGFKGKWGSGVGEEKAGVLQALSRLSYMDFLSHCRRVVLDFDTGMKLQGPRRLHTSQFGYFCTNETPGGASIGITKNLSNLATISLSTNPTTFIQWLLTRGGVIACDQVTPIIAGRAVPVFVNAGIIGFTMRPIVLRDVTKLMKWSGCLPATTSISFSIREKRVLFYLDEGRPVRPLIHLGKQGRIPLEALKSADTWRNLVMGKYPATEKRGLASTTFVDPFSQDTNPTLDEYRAELEKYVGVIEYVDPYEANESYIATFAEHIHPESSHMEIHPSTIFGLMTSVIPYANHNQSPRNQLSCSQSKQGVSVYATNYANRFDNQVHVLCYGEAPIVRTLYYDYVANGQMGYGQNIVLAMGCFSGYNQEDGIVMNADAIQRGMFNSVFYRSYECREEDDPRSFTSTRIGNPANTPIWLNLRPGLDYSKLDERGIIREGESVDENTVLVGRYIKAKGGEIRDASLTAQVWTTGRVEKTTVLVGNNNLAMVKIRVIQYRVPELGDKFSNRHGQKGTIGMLIRGHDMPRSESGLVPDMIMNTHAIPSRMTIAQLLEAILGKAAALTGAIGNATTFMNEGSPAEAIGRVLQNQFGMQPMGEELLYDGTTGTMIPSTIFMGTVYTMRLKHMTEDKWNARAEGRKEMRTHQPTGGRGNQGGLRMGEMERDAVLGHGIASFVHESYMKRADGTEIVVCNGCGTIPIYNEKKNLYMCSMCDGPVNFIGETANNLELLPATKRSIVSFSKVEMPYAFKLLEQELSTYMNIGMRILTTKDLQKLEAPTLRELTEVELSSALSVELKHQILLDTVIPEFVQPIQEPAANVEDLSALSAVAGPVEEELLPVQANASAANAFPLEANAANAGTLQAPAAQEELLEEEPALEQSANAPLQLGPAPQQTGPYLVVPLGQQQQVQQQVQQQQQEPYIANNSGPAAQILQPAMPGAPPMIAVDTTQQQQQQQQRNPIRSALKTRRVAFSNQPQQQQQQQQPQQSQNNVRINVNKLG
jgi:DNA-directed RNA polymerase II subunit RPB2